MSSSSASAPPPPIGASPLRHRLAVLWRQCEIAAICTGGPDPLGTISFLHPGRHRYQPVAGLGPTAPT